MTGEPGADPGLIGTAARLRYRGCWREAADLLAGAARHDPEAAVERSAVLVEQCMFTVSGWDDAEAATAHALALARRDGDRARALGEHGFLAYTATLFGGVDRAAEAAALLDTAVALAEGTRAWAWIEFRRGLVAENLRCRPDEAEATYRRAHAASLAAGDALLRSYTCRHLAGLAAERGDLAAAQEGFGESLRLRLECGFTVGVAPALVALAGVTAADDAAVLRAQARMLVQALGGVPAWLVQEAVEEVEE